MRHLFLRKSAKEESDTLEKSNSVTSDVTWRMNARRACPASRASPTEKSRRACALGATMKGQHSRKHGYRPLDRLYTGIVVAVVAMLAVDVTAIENERHRASPQKTDLS